MKYLWSDQLTQFVPTAGFPGPWTFSDKPGKAPGKPGRLVPTEGQAPGERWGELQSFASRCAPRALFLDSACGDGRWGGSLGKRTYNLGLLRFAAVVTF